MRSSLVVLIAFALTCPAVAQTPPPPAKRLPPAGIAIPDNERIALTAGAAALRKDLDALAVQLASKPVLRELLPDIEIYHKAVDWALRYDEFFDPSQVGFAHHLLEEGQQRLQQLSNGKAPWLEATGLVIRGYRSSIDGSVQPFALVVPAGPARGDRTKPMRLDIVLAGRNEKRTELAFMAEHEKSGGEIVPPDAVVLHPYGRYCNATKFAGEMDVLEARQATAATYAIDPNRVVLRGFSMGGASTWHLAVHYPTAWTVASPGAGFAETAVYTKAFAPGKEPPAWWEQKLWRWYDATSSAANLFNCPTIAYSGEIDPQKQSADIMETAMKTEGLALERLIGPQTGHKYHPDSRKQLATRLDEIVAKGRDPLPREIRFTTYTLRYSRAAWLQLLRLEKHWERADVIARLESPDVVTVQTRNVAAFALELARLKSVSIDGQKLNGPFAGDLTFRKLNGNWLPAHVTEVLAIDGKQPGLTGPIDDAFMGSFLFVRPTGQSLNEKSGRWVERELTHAFKLWRDIFRGYAPIKDDTAVTADDMRRYNLVLWGDPFSNKIIRQLLQDRTEPRVPQALRAKLPLEWDARELHFAGKSYDATHHMPMLVFPNPMARGRYIVLNSGMDFRDEAYGTNALQVPKLPDYAIVDLDTPPGPKWPGKIVDAGFFDETWQVPR